MECDVDGCDNQAFKGNNECALHCTKNNYQVDRNSGLLSNFNRLLKGFVSKEIIDGASATEVPHIMLFLKFIDGKLSHEEMQEESFSLYKNQKDEEMTDIDEIISNQIFNFSGFHFPTRDSRDSYDYLKWLKHVGGIHFINCFFYLRTLDLENTRIFFDSCTFEEEFSFSPMSLVENFYNSIFSHCNFLKNFEIAPITDRLENNIYNYSVLYNCNYLGNVTLRNSVFNEEVFYREKDSDDNYSIEISNLEVIDCIFENRFKINYSKMTNLKISNSHFKSKFEIKNSEVDSFEFENSNVDGIFDAYKSFFVKAKFYKSIFKDFAAFEYVIFGDEKKENITDFIYTTFKDFSNFRNTKFKSGLNFSSANIKQEPNFLNTDINLVGTDRETLRIIKNSFEKVNNKIESNRFFIYEMMRYKREVNNDSKESIYFLKLFIAAVFSCNEYVLNIIGASQVFKNVMSAFSKKIVLSANYYISRFGESYIQPLMIFLFSIGLYTYILEVHKDIFSEEPVAQYVVLLRNFVTQDWFISLSKFLNTCAANVPLFSKALEKKSGIEFISIMFFIWFGILTWQIIIAVKRNTQH
ncbi:hypothetical protein [Psychrobacter sp. JB385]|uniref:hypothetical protein n=1 Tax=Psychrobacter sp. JB385 TaxID=1434841 RepID=UPI00097F4F9A|nr:hypothetical protein [Psychrobacter sp. JB385]SJN15478.1 hypothetical protein CZ794_00305 [Psychrobacter sp. JB385]